jgi:hypothetical protein
MGLVVIHDPGNEGADEFGVTGVRSLLLHSFICIDLRILLMAINQNVYVLLYSNNSIVTLLLNWCLRVLRKLIELLVQRSSQNLASPRGFLYFRAA